MSRETMVATAFVELADNLEDGFEVLDFMQTLVDRSVAILYASGACLTLADARGELRLIASTSNSAQSLELTALANAEGPCIDAFATGEAVVNVKSAEAVARWPRFMDAAAALHFRAVHVVPLGLGSRVLGALSLLYAEPVELTEDDQVLATALAKVAAIGLLHEPTPRQKELLAERLQIAVDERVALEQAKGIVAERAHIDMESAFQLLLRHSRQAQHPLSTIAARVLDGSLSLAELHRDV
jgi:GAF domain-containing protein